MPCCHQNYHYQSLTKDTYCCNCVVSFGPKHTMPCVDSANVCTANTNNAIAALLENYHKVTGAIPHYCQYYKNQWYPKPVSLSK